ncbi:glutamine-hydrolyzing carbamoyl-phosphate synthase small subunit [Tellurirhabdus rosea]|uniref:glutamine-hydrolyzing carbamoyl-phosphate synthase small subunit n=1 Tax=Tellurirhabdus rosea TaxID=2674997 RepID=UPI002259EFDB|nr:glutamine-hydrolyzing carbamoyl-phosphate synthase small subunit [Tellurirhabdus rosea]
MQKRSNHQEALLVLEDGTVFKGLALGKIGTAGGEICFNTGMTGYQEIYTDPSYYGQVIVNTNSHIGNYGVQLETEEESNGVKISGMVCNFFSQIHSRHTADSSLQEYFEKSNIVGISGVDTRQIVRHIRDKGVMNCIISSEILDPAPLLDQLKAIPDMEGLELSSQVCTQRIYDLDSARPEFRVAVLDLGVKKSILTNLTDRGAHCRVFPATTPFEEIAAWNPDGYFISNGPGDPAAMPYAAETVRQALDTNKPLFGICLGHQVLSLASGLSTYKMHNGHRGLNHPVKNLITGRCEVTSQNHGFAVRAEDVMDHPDVELTHVNLNDKTIEGIRRKDKPAFSVQYHPEASPGPHDSRYLFDEFVGLIQQSK